ncbi:preprotein translocase subunit SecE [Candidatus Peregrinibacteria bacterium]|nr:preprotein translocase subunit SecE [Candidatus Peregrinibacteria bacterium]
MKSPLDYFKGAVHELKNVTWPTQKQAIRLSIITIVFVLSGAVVFGFLDGLLSTLFFSFTS